MNIKTPESHPDHHTVGEYFLAWNGLVYYCDSYDSSLGYWMTNALDHSDRRNVSGAAVGRTFHIQQGLVRKHHDQNSHDPFYAVSLSDLDSGPLPVLRAHLRAHDHQTAPVFAYEGDAKKFARVLRAARSEMRAKASTT